MTHNDPYAAQPRNRLAGEASPYLRQHAENPVGWWPWGEEALRLARETNRPIFLSVGYSTCHWCHVMAHESFEDAEVAGLLNEAFVPIKLDREERPDIDAIYMDAVMAMNGHGGWPMSVFLTPDSHAPFFAGTYFPKAHFMALLQRIRDLWQTQEKEIREDAAKVAAHIADVVVAPPGEPMLGTLVHGVRDFQREFDATHGGFGSAPKFPRTHDLSFLLRAASRSPEAVPTEGPSVEEMVATTLDTMARGGIHDHLGGGFHRYSVDAKWLVPHFEKMLYDQALLATTYLEAFQATGEADWADIVRDILDYVARDLRSPEGAFFCAEDADSEGVEGKFYVFTPAEFRAALDGEDEADIARLMELLGVSENGNFEHGWSILHLPGARDSVTESFGVDRWQALRHRLREFRDARVRPHRDEKVLTDWSALMISAYSRAGYVLGEASYTQIAEEAATFILSTMQRPDGRLLHRFTAEHGADIPAFLSDYAFLAQALFDLFSATGSPRWLQEARRLADALIELFSDDAQDGLFQTATDQTGLLRRSQEVFDGATPSGNAVGALALMRLGHLFADGELFERGARIVRQFDAQLTQLPRGHTMMLQAADYLLGPRQEIVLATPDADSPATQNYREVLRRRFLPRSLVVTLDVEAAEFEALVAMVPYLAAYKPIAGQPAVYICTNYACQAPIRTLDGLEASLDEAQAE